MGTALIMKRFRTQSQCYNKISQFINVDASKNEGKFERQHVHKVFVNQISSVMMNL